MDPLVIYFSSLAGRSVMAFAGFICRYGILCLCVADNVVMEAYSVCIVVDSFHCFAADDFSAMAANMAGHNI